jgi:hypothetical protein
MALVQLRREVDLRLEGGSEASLGYPFYGFRVYGFLGLGFYSLGGK